MGRCGRHQDRRADHERTRRADGGRRRTRRSGDGLFAAVFDDQLEHIVDAVPFDALDLPGYAVRLYDSYLREPALIRLTSWNRLRRVPVGDLLRGRSHLAQPKLDAIAAAQAQGCVVPELQPAEVCSMVIALVSTWSPVSGTFAASRWKTTPTTDAVVRRCA